MDGTHLLPSTPDTISWGWLPNRGSRPVLTIRSGDTVTIDTISHEGVLEDAGRDPVAFFGRYGVAPSDVLQDAVDLAASDVPHRWRVDGPHVVTGPIHVAGATPGDVLQIEVLSLRRRTPYGVISNRHGLGVLPGELPDWDPDPDADDPARRLGTEMTFCPVEGERGVLRAGAAAMRFPLAPFLGIMGVAVATEEPVHSTPPGRHGGNLDVNLLGEGSTLYLPVQVDGAGFYVGDPHYAQGDGEVSLTALEAPLRATVRLTVVDRGPLPDAPFGETAEHWIAIGLDEDLDEAMRDAVRHALAFLTGRFPVPKALAYAYLSAATDFEVTQVVDRVKGIHGLIRKADFHDFTGF